MIYSIAIDGPSGAGKSTVAKEVAKKLGFTYIDTGAMYRVIALYLIRNNIDCENEEDIKKVIDDIHIKIDYIDGIQMLYLNGEDVTKQIRTEEIGSVASKASVFPIVRNKLTAMQKEIAKTTSVIMDGRDIATVVLPNANWKIFLTASLDERANRRFLELKNKNVNTTFEKVKEELSLRDYRDTHREIAPLKETEESIIIDSTNLNFNEVVEKILKIVVID